MSFWSARKRRKRLRTALRERDGDDCHLCRGTMLFKGNPFDDHFATLDHITPRSAGGTFDINNLKLAHRRCNLLRGDGPVKRMGWE